MVYDQIIVDTPLENIILWCQDDGMTLHSVVSLSRYDMALFLKHGIIDGEYFNVIMFDYNCDIYCWKLIDQNYL